MADFPIDRPWELVLSGVDERRLMVHLFRRDGDEHGATIVAGVHTVQDRVRLLVRHIALATDGIDHVSGSLLFTCWCWRPERNQYGACTAYDGSSPLCLLGGANQGWKT